VENEARVAPWQTGGEMEAMTAVSVAVLPIYDMCKAVEMAMSLTMPAVEKRGGKSGSTFWKGAPLAPRRAPAGRECPRPRNRKAFSSPRDWLPAPLRVLRSPSSYRRS
jgi:hypothetical protein